MLEAIFTVTAAFKILREKKKGLVNSSFSLIIIIKHSNNGEKR